MSAWDKRQKEAVKWYNRFLFYRDLGPERALLAAYRGYHEQILKEPYTNKDSINGDWANMAKKHEWAERAQKWDDHVRVKLEDKSLDLQTRLMEEMGQLALSLVQKTRAAVEAKDEVELKKLMPFINAGALLKKGDLLKSVGEIYKAYAGEKKHTTIEGAGFEIKFED